MMRVMSRDKEPPKDIGNLDLQLDGDLLRRIGVVAGRKRKDPQALAREFVIERLYEEEKREGILTSPTDLSDPSLPVGGEDSSGSPMTGLIEIYTDGGCKDNPGPGGWAAIIYEGPRPEEISGAERRTPARGWSYVRPSRV